MKKADYEQYESKNTIDLDKEGEIDNSIIKEKLNLDKNIKINDTIINEDIKVVVEKKNNHNKENIQNNEKNMEQNIENNIENVSSNLETLDESIGDTLKRDFTSIYQKVKHVLLPRFSGQRVKDLQNWDLWGPLLFCLILSITIAFSQESSDTDSRGSVFIIIFVIFWIGGLIISLNSQFLGCNLFFFQTLCLLGYCIVPIVISALIIRLISAEKFIKVIILGVAYLWSCISSVSFISGIVQPEKKMISVYPVFLFYLVLSWFVLTL